MSKFNEEYVQFLKDHDAFIHDLGKKIQNKIRSKHAPKT